MFSPIDLRWGITTKQLEEGQVVNICLGTVEISRPFFVTCLGERYGWLARYRALEAQSTAWMQGCEYAEGFVRLGTEMAGFSGPIGFGPAPAGGRG